ncbi:MAG: hypothetical protein JW820_04730 [Spirochaetales bacterium]|nr:hypothetical protein [Spirochaetales bacterium]
MVEGVRRAIFRQLSSAETGGAVFRLVYVPVLAGLVAWGRREGGFAPGVHGVLAGCVLLAWGYSGSVLALVRSGRLREGLSHVSALVDAAVGSACLALAFGVSAPLWRHLLPWLAVLQLFIALWLAAARLFPANAVVSGVFTACGAAAAAAAAAVAGTAGAAGPATADRLVAGLLIPVGLALGGAAAWQWSRTSLGLLRKHYLSDDLARARKRLAALEGALTAAAAEVSSSSTELQTSTAAASVRLSQEHKALEAASAAAERLDSDTSRLQGSLGAIWPAAQRSAEAARGATEAVQQVNARIAAVQEVAHQMGASLDLINEVTDQTSLLALNAAIEASRGGGGSAEGFPVVAEEIRTLAERSAGIAAEIGRLVKQMKTAITAAEAASRETGRVLERIRVDAADVETFSATAGGSLEEQAGVAAALREALEQAQGFAAQSAAAADAVLRLGGRMRDEGARLRSLLDGPPPARKNS